MKAPETYFEWKDMLEKFANGDDSMITFLSTGIMILNAGTAIRYHQLVNETYVKRKQLWLDKFKVITQKQIIHSASDFGVYLNQTKTGLRILIDFTNLPSFSADLRKMLHEDLTTFVTDIKKSLKQNVIRDRNSNMNTLLLAIDNLDVHKVEIAQNVSQQPENNIPNRRRIIF